MTAPAISALLERLGLPSDVDPAIFEQAVTHVSYSAEHPPHPHYERLEFLGDAVLKFAMADLLFARFPGDPEGPMTQVLTRVVSDQTLAIVARRLELGSFLRLGAGEIATGGRDRIGTLASSLEAILAAVYLSCGIDRASTLVARLLESEIASAHTEPGGENFKALLQERTQHFLGQLPRYRVIADTLVTPYEHLFEVAVEVDGLTRAQGAGPTKRAAEQEAARLALVEMGWSSHPHPLSRP